MASVSTDPKGNRMVQFIASDGKRRTVRLGKMDMKTVRDVARRIDALNIATIAGQVLDRENAEWLATIGDKLHEKIAAVGLAAPRSGAMPALGAFLADFIAKRETGKQGTTLSRQTSANRLTEFFGEKTPINAITPGQADEWLLWMTSSKHYARATIGRTVKHAKGFFRAAVRLKLLRENPFHDLKAPGQKNEARKVFISHDIAAQVLDACPDAEWRLIFALSRFAVHRNTSRCGGKTWIRTGIVFWSARRKLEHHDDGGERWVPIFPELRPYLEDCRELADDESGPVIKRRRSSAQRWGMLLGRILAKAGIAQWEKIFHNLRASRQTELTALYPIGTVCRWLGNSEDIADAHYLMALESDFERASRDGALQIPVQQSETNGDKPMQTSTGDGSEMPENTQGAKKHPEACKSQGG